MGDPVRFKVGGETVHGVLEAPPAGAPTHGRSIVLLHGLLSCRAEFMDAPERLAEMGYHVLAFDQRGFGQSDGARGVHSRHAVVAELRAAFDVLKARGVGERVALVGHSLGAAYATFALGEAHDPGFSAAVLVAPVSSIRGELGALEFRMYQVADLVSRAKAAMGMGPLKVPYKNRYKDLFMDARCARRAQEVGFLDASISLANYNELMAVDAPAWARGVRVPSLVVLCEHDKAVKHASSRQVYDELAGKKEIVTIESGHSAFGDVRQKELLAHLDRWCSRWL